MTYRVYFNRRNEAPQVWSIDNGSQESEINVQFVNLENVLGTSFYLETNDPENKPCAWFEVMGAAHFHDGGVTIRG